MNMLMKYLTRITRISALTKLFPARMAQKITSNLLKDDKGIALVTSLLLTLITLTMVMALLYMVTQSTKVSGANKRYKTALEASYGGSELYTKDILPYLLQNFGSTTLASSAAVAFSPVGLQIVASQVCLQSKLTLPSGKWPVGCSNSSSPKQSPDLTFNLLSTTANSYTIYSKIVETMLGNTDASGLQLEGAGVAEATAGITPQHFPYLYRLEIQGEQTTASSAQANIEVLYAY
jgi:hypothetical protein